MRFRKSETIELEMDLDHEPGFGTLLSHFAEDQKVQGAVTPPIFQNSLFVFDTVEELFDTMGRNPGGPPYHYSRVSNPTVDIAEQKIAKLERMDACKVFGSGMGAISAAVLSCVKTGSHVVALDTVYGPARQFISEYLTRFGVTHTFVDGRCADQVIDACKPETSLIYLESPSSILFRLQDFEPIIKFARERDISTITDNTYNTPLHMQPGSLGVDLVLHSASKYLGGHSDITAGVLCGSHTRIGNILRQEVALLGALLHPFSAWLLIRGLRTLEVRVQRHEATANAVAAWIEDRPEVDVVHHLGLPSYPQRDLYRKYMTGSGGLFSFEPKDQSDSGVRRFCNSLRLFQRGVSWGGFESLVVPIKLETSPGSPHRWVVRLFCGLEDPKDLISDLEQAFGEGARIEGCGLREVHA